MSRFDHSSLGGFDSTGVQTGLFKMEYVIHFHGAARPANLPLLGKAITDITLDCGKLRPMCSENTSRDRRVFPSEIYVDSVFPQWRENLFVNAVGSCDQCFIL